MFIWQHINNIWRTCDGEEIIYFLVFTINLVFFVASVFSNRRDASFWRVWHLILWSGKGNGGSIAWRLRGSAGTKIRFYVRKAVQIPSTCEKNLDHVQSSAKTLSDSKINFLTFNNLSITLKYPFIRIIQLFQLPSSSKILHWSIKIQFYSTKGLFTFHRNIFLPKFVFKFFQVAPITHRFLKINTEKKLWKNR